MTLRLNPLPPTVVEIVERRSTASAGMVVPNEVRINGMPVLVAADSLTVNPGTYCDPATVTLTLIVDSLSVHREEDTVSPSRRRYLDRLRAEMETTP